MSKQKKKHNQAMPNSIYLKVRQCQFLTEEMADELIYVYKRDKGIYELIDSVIFPTLDKYHGKLNHNNYKLKKMDIFIPIINDTNNDMLADMAIDYVEMIDELSDGWFSREIKTLDLPIDQNLTEIIMLNKFTSKSNEDLLIVTVLVTYDDANNHRISKIYTYSK